MEKDRPGPGKPEAKLYTGARCKVLPSALLFA